MNLLAGLVLAPILALVIRNRRTLFGILTAVWAIGLAPTAHVVLRRGNPTGSMPDTLSFFVVSYIGLALSLGLAYLVNRRRHPTTTLASAA
jgi:hypothetical protein